MFGQGALRVELRRDNRLSTLDVHYDRVLIGSGAHCDVRLAPDEAALEQLSIQLVGDDEVYAQTRAVEPPCLLNGAPFLEGRLLPTSLLELGPVALRVSRIDKVEPGHERKRSPKSATSPVVQALGVFGVLVGLYVVLAEPDTATSAVERRVNPPPTAASKPRACAQTEPRAALALAEQAELEAESQRERSPFDAGAGPAAIAWFETAAGCYASAQDEEHAREAAAAASQLAAQVGDEIHVRHVRLERYLARGEYADARRQALLLAKLVNDKSSGYARWLSSVRRESELRTKQGQHR